MVVPLSDSVEVMVTGRPSMAEEPGASIAHMAYAVGPPGQVTTWSVGVVPPPWQRGTNENT